MPLSPLVDVHTHLYPPQYLDALAQRDTMPCVTHSPHNERLFHIFPDDPGRAITDDYWSLDAKLAFMDRSSITHSVVSLGNPWLDCFDRDDSLRLAAALNEEFAGFAARTDGRIVGMGCLPSGGIRDVVSTIESIAQTDGLAGVVTGTRLAGYEFDAEELLPVWAAFEAHRLPILVHPHYGVGIDEMGGYGHAMPLALGFPFETTLALTKLVGSGVLDRHPNLMVIGSHGGGTVPYLAGRIDGCWRPDEIAQRRHGSPPSAQFARLILDSLVYDPRSLRAAANLVGSHQLVFGTDHPFAIADPATNIAAIESTFDDPSEIARVRSLNAALLFRLPLMADDTTGV